MIWLIGNCVHLSRWTSFDHNAEAQLDAAPADACIVSEEPAAVTQHGQFDGALPALSWLGDSKQIQALMLKHSRLLFPDASLRETAHSSHATHSFCDIMHMT